MSDELGRGLASKLDKKLAAKSRRKTLDDGFKRGKVVNEVLDKPTVMTLYGMIKDGVITGVNGAISAGKESVVFWGEDGAKSVALKVYLVSTSNFKRREPYMLGDPRFSRIRKGTRNMVYAWAKKEFRNMVQCHESGLPVPRPIHVSNNVLAMEFVGDGGMPAPLLHNSAADAGDYEQAISIMHGMYAGAGLVHGDYSEYNVFKAAGGLVAFDLGSAVDLRHPNSDGFLKRDISNINRFFGKRGVPVRDPDAIHGEITGGDDR